MAVFNSSSRTASTCSRAQRSSSTSFTSRPKSMAKQLKPSKPSLVQRVSSSMKPAPKPKPTLLRRAMISLDTSSWEKRVWERLQQFPDNHPLLMKLLGTGLCLASVGAGAMTMPAFMAAVGFQGAVAAGLGGLLTAATTTATGAVHGATFASGAAAGAKILFSSVALDVGASLLAKPSPPRRFKGLFPRRTRSSTSPTAETSASVVPLVPKPWK